MSQYQYKIEVENFDDGKGRLESSLKYAMNYLTYNGLIYAETILDENGRQITYVTNLDFTEVYGKTIEEIESLLDSKINKRRSTVNCELEIWKTALETN